MKHTFFLEEMIGRGQRQAWELAECKGYCLVSSNTLGLFKHISVSRQHLQRQSTLSTSVIMANHKTTSPSVSLSNMSALSASIACLYSVAAAQPAQPAQPTCHVCVRQERLTAQPSNLSFLPLLALVSIVLFIFFLRACTSSHCLQRKEMTNACKTDASHDQT